MLNKDKIIIVAYVNVGSIHDDDIRAFLKRTAEALKPEDDGSSLFYIIPVREEDSRIECINPKFVSEEEYEKVRKTCEKISEKLAELENDNCKH